MTYLIVPSSQRAVDNSLMTNVLESREVHLTTGQMWEGKTVSLVGSENLSPLSGAECSPSFASFAFNCSILFSSSEEDKISLDNICFRFLFATLCLWISCLASSSLFIKGWLSSLGTEIDVFKLLNLSLSFDSRSVFVLQLSTCPLHHLNICFRIFGTLWGSMLNLD